MAQSLAPTIAAAQTALQAVISAIPTGSPEVGSAAYTTVLAAAQTADGMISGGVTTADANMNAVIAAASPSVIGGIDPNSGVVALNAAGQAASDLAVLTAMRGFSSRMVANIQNASS